MASTNNSLNNRSSTAIANANQTFTISNSDNTGTSAAQLIVSVGGGTTTGDPKESWIVTGGSTWSQGIDNSVSDSFTVAASASLGTTNAHTITTTGQNQWPLQPATLGILTATSNNRTGNGATVFTIGAATAPYTEVFDKRNSMSAGVFTAPTTSVYMVTGSVTLTGCTINSGIQIQLQSSNRIYVKSVVRPASSADNVINLTAIADMDAADTVFLRVSGFGEAGNTDDVMGGTATAVTYFTVYMMA